MTGDLWTSAVRRQLGLGRVLPLGGAGDGAWLTESAARVALLGPAERVAGARVTGLRVGPAGSADGRAPAKGYVAAVPAPPSALPPGPLRISADFTAGTDEPLPAVAARLRTALGTAAVERLGLEVAEVDLRVTGLSEPSAEDAGAPATRPGAPPTPSTPPKPPTPLTDEPAATLTAGTSGEDALPGEAVPSLGDPEGLASAPDSDEGRVTRACLAVPGVTRMAGTLGGLGRAVHVTEQSAPHALPRRHVRVELAADTDHRTLDVARAVRTAVTEALPDHPTVAVLITSLERPQAKSS
ncbi:hypothetical protein [Streptomyces aureocirculatus]|uniref:hypothetical protein n=1 Tax=Streptomyces aureocirculatus TaxID=67275 RepID=UPI0004CBEE86|nr:hypothetical protein [Streptomyces aureocirculatus]